MRFRKKPIVIEAHVVEKPYKQLAEWCGGTLITEDGRKVVGILIDTLEGNMLAKVGDWIIQGVNGEFYPCKPDIFVQTYDPEESPNA